MFSVMIVDDEKRTIDGIVDSIDWAKHEITDVKWAQNGQQALIQLDEKPADIVITDINMPRMNGIELAHQLWETRPQTKVVFVTGYSDINYIRSAFKYEAVDYIMKPINIQELNAAIEKSIRSLKEDSEKKNYLNEIERKLKISLPLMQDKFFKKLITDGIKNNLQLTSDIERLQLQLQFRHNYVVLVLLVNNFKYQDEWNNLSLFSTAVINITQELISKESQGYCFEHSEDEFVCILPLSEVEINTKNIEAISHRLQTIGNEISTHLENILGVTLSIGVGSVAHDLSQIEGSFVKAKQALSRRFFCSKTQILFDQNSSDNCLPSYISVDFNQYQRIYNLSIQEDTLQVVFIIKNLFESIHSAKNPNEYQVIVICHQIVSAVNSALLEKGNLNDEQQQGITLIYDTLQNCSTISEMEEELLAYVRLNVGSNLEKNPTEQDELIAGIKKYIDENYTEAITLSVLAGEAFICQSYLCLLFKQKTGTTITNYITDVRLEKAKQMLKNSDKKLIEVCFDVGFNDSKYFSRIFKKYTGFTPSEFRISQQNAI